MSDNRTRRTNAATRNGTKHFLSAQRWTTPALYVGRMSGGFCPRGICPERRLTGDQCPDNGSNYYYFLIIRQTFVGKIVSDLESRLWIWRHLAWMVLVCASSRSDSAAFSRHLTEYCSVSWDISRWINSRSSLYTFTVHWCRSSEWLAVTLRQSLNTFSAQWI